MTNAPRPGDQAPDNPWQTGGPARQPQPGQQPDPHQPGQPGPGQPGQPHSGQQSGQQPQPGQDRQSGQQGQWAHGGYDQGQGQQQSWYQQWGQQDWSQRSAEPPYGQPAAGQPSGGYYQQWQTQPAKPRFSDANPLKAALDFSFDSYATPGLVKIIYILAVVLGALWWIGGTIVMFVAAASQPEITGYSSGPSGSDFVPAILSLLLGWIPVLLWLLLVRVLLEAAMALVRTASDVRALRSDAESES
jgi:hypothetical protein